MSLLGYFVTLYCIGIVIMLGTTEEQRKELKNV